MKRLDRFSATLLAAIALSGCGGGESDAVKIDRYREVADFRFTNQQEESFERSDLVGKIWVADFIFTSCAAECVVLAQKMRLLQEHYADRPDVVFVSFSVDPQTDTPERLAQYGEKWGADPERWQFITSEVPRELDFLVKQSFLLPVARSNEEKVKLMTGNLVHTSKFAIVDREGVVRSYVEGLDLDAFDKVVSVVDTLLEEQSLGL